MQKIGILGGTFNPIHIGHLTIAQNTLEECNLNKVIFIPSGISYFKDQNTIVSKEHRINMVKAAINNNPCFDISTIETERDGNSYTYETILELKNENTSLYYIIGADTLFSMESWKNPNIIFQNSTIVCSKRNNMDETILINKKIELEEKYSCDIVLLNSPELDISSTDIRNNIKAGKSCKYYLTDSVIEYIKENKLYVL